MVGQTPRYQNLQFLKLGGSLITEKKRPHTPRLKVLARLAGEIADTLRDNPDLRLILGHGSGSFGHVPAERYATRQGVRTPEEWLGFTQVWREAAALNHLVMDALLETGMPAVSFAPSAMVTVDNGQVTSWNLSPIRAALEVGLTPVVYGDVIFDTSQGGTIFSTEDLFVHMAKRLLPDRLLLAGLETGVWFDYPRCTSLISEITPDNYDQYVASIGDSVATDVTGGMAGKVKEMLTITKQVPRLEVLIFSGERQGNLRKVLEGGREGTTIRDSTL
jgi:isopentenyl phosphate kinase